MTDLEGLQQSVDIMRTHLARLEAADDRDLPCEGQHLRVKVLARLDQCFREGTEMLTGRLRPVVDSLAHLQGALPFPWWVTFFRPLGLWVCVGNRGAGPAEDVWWGDRNLSFGVPPSSSGMTWEQYSMAHGLGGMILGLEAGIGVLPDDPEEFRRRLVAEHQARQQTT